MTTSSSRLWKKRHCIFFIMFFSLFCFDELATFILIHTYDKPLALYTKNVGGYHSDCCFTNRLLRILGRIEKGCELARHGDFVVLPEDIDVGGVLRGDFEIFTNNGINELLDLFKVDFGCDLVTRDSLPKSVRW